MKYDAQREAEVQGTRIMMQNQTAAYMDLAARNTSKGSMRYQVFAVADENCDSVGERLSYFDELEGGPNTSSPTHPQLLGCPMALQSSTTPLANTILALALAWPYQR